MLIIDGQLPHQEAEIDGLIQFAVDRIHTGIAAAARPFPVRHSGSRRETGRQNDR
jgi:hypothetical protein